MEQNFQQFIKKELFISIIRGNMRKKLHISNILMGLI